MIASKNEYFRSYLFLHTGKEISILTTIDKHKIRVLVSGILINLCPMKMNDTLNFI